ncbi:hypothetical protein FSP39_012802 [Pinctada imbricata]|uniref:Uncharacterized protein n=1 Tax=Pinctada imbricata TaxID=66713 RepID=A0AA88YVX3_PINIB|nr:hypothetical protein FSP39_012802 [Pinctada imbricata]
MNLKSSQQCFICEVKEFLRVDRRVDQRLYAPKSCEGQPEKSLHEEPHNACLVFKDKEYRNLPDSIEDIRYNAFISEEDGKVVWCRTICPGLPFNAVMSGYKKAARQK